VVPDIVGCLSPGGLSGLGGRPLSFIYSQGGLTLDLSSILTTRSIFIDLQLLTAIMMALPADCFLVQDE
jgi:hypothetical protein